MKAWVIREAGAAEQLKLEGVAMPQLKQYFDLVTKADLELKTGPVFAFEELVAVPD